MSYELNFYESALKEWKKLDKQTQNLFKKKLKERLNDPIVQASKLRGMQDCYKIKLVASGYRLVYQVIDNELVVLVITVGRRDKNIYQRAADIVSSLRNR